jgi:peptide/nickel transport system substrate-binding protein
MRILARLVLACLTVGTLAAPAAAETTVKVVMHSALRVLDPIVTTAYITRNHGYMIYDTLFAQDENFAIQPQMVRSWTLSPDKLTYTFVLRDGLKWHDGQPVTAEDCVASIKRWSQTDTMGQKLMEYTASLTAPDARTIRLQLKSPYGLVLDSLGKPSSNVPFMMPRRLAEMPANKALGPAEQVGSGPFKFVQAEFQPGVKAVYVKNPDYVPRSEKPSWGAGGKVVKVDRVEWVTMPDHQTAVNALIAGEIDYMESPPHDLYPLLENATGVKMHVINKLGLQGMLRFNHLHPPFDNPKIRQAVAYAVNQEDYMKAWISDPRYRRTCFAMFVCNTPLATDAGSDGLMRGNVEKARQLLKAGFKVDVQAMDWQTLVGRRAKQEPPSQGGWNMFHTNWVAHDVMNPIGNAGVNTKGAKGGWFGWPEDAQIEDMRDRFARESDPAKQKKIAEDIQRRAYEIGAYLPLGEYTAAIAFRGDRLSGILDGPVPYLWNVEKK